MKKLLNRVRDAVRAARASQLGRYIPNNKVIAGALAAGITLALKKTGLVDIPAEYVAAGAFAVVAYLFPESPVAAAHVVAKSLVGDVNEAKIAAQPTPPPPSVAAEQPPSA